MEQNQKYFRNCLFLLGAEQVRLAKFILKTNFHFENETGKAFYLEKEIALSLKMKLKILLNCN